MTDVGVTRDERKASHPLRAEGRYWNRAAASHWLVRAGAFRMRPLRANGRTLVRTMVVSPIFLLPVYFVTTGLLFSVCITRLSEITCLLLLSIFMFIEYHRYYLHIFFHLFLRHTHRRAVITTTTGWQRSHADHHRQEREHNGGPCHAKETVASLCNNPVACPMSIDEMHELHRNHRGHRGRHSQTDKTKL